LNGPILFEATAIDGQNTFLAEAGKLSVWGQKEGLTALKCHFRFASESGLKSNVAPCPKSAMNGLMQRNMIGAKRKTANAVVLPIRYSIKELRARQPSAHDRAKLPPRLRDLAESDELI
jgi:hypothetical protein